MNKEIRDYLRFRTKLVVLNFAKRIGSNAKAIRIFNIPKSTFYKWKTAYDKYGEEGLKRKKPIAYTYPRALKAEVVDKILELRREATNSRLNFIGM